MSISIALTKGRLEKATVKLLEERGYGIESLKDKGRALVFQDTKKDIRYFLVNPMTASPMYSTALRILVLWERIRFWRVARIIMKCWI